MLEYYPDFLSVRDAMEVLGVSKSTIYELIREQKVPAFRLGPKLWRIRKDSLLEYLKTQA